ncbi:helix-turn-helix domain-containing protein [Secundilactobacillus yichangensis]|uniref:helix-turn-helix domain-containing protein n=1 Tax=Secundilactobacillus yichangensis TaxID=2799580 RepID=UPI0019436B9F|nr:helix-turn-helix transcriptional regulator [Secundilactobacillus yichangensis]
MDNELIQRIINLRESHDWTQKDLADRINTSKVTMNKIEHGVRKVSSSELKQLADVFGVSTDYLLGHDTSSTPKHIDVEDIVDQQAMLTSRNHALSDEDRNAIRALLTTYLNSSEGQDRLRKFGGYDDEGNKKDEK